MQSEKLSIQAPEQDCGLNLCFVLNIDKLLDEIESVRTNRGGALLASYKDGSVRESLREPGAKAAERRD